MTNPLKNKFPLAGRFPSPSWRFLIIIVLSLGIFFRAANLEKKVIWGDEAFSSLRISGYIEKEVLDQAFNGQVIGVEKLQTYQQTNLEKNWLDTIRSLEIDSPHHPPFYFLLARNWENWFGHGINIKRSLPALMSLFTFPALYWFSLELFASSLVGWVAIALVAVSPFHLLYAQEVRQYSLWTVLILLSSASLLWAIRSETQEKLKKNPLFAWGLYTLSLTLSLYTFLFSALVAIVQGIYVAILTKFRWTTTLKSYLISSFIALILFLPWIVIIINHRLLVNARMDWTTKTPSDDYLLNTWSLNLIRAFFDFSLAQKDPFYLEFSYQNLFAYLLLPTLALVGYALYFLCRHTSRQVWLFIFLLMGITSLPLILPDLIFGGQRSTIGRYLVPCYLGIHLSVAYLFGQKISGQFHQKSWRILFVIILSGGILSGTTIVQADTWWNKYSEYYNHEVAAVIHQTEKPLILSDSLHSRILALSHLLDPKVSFMLFEEPEQFSQIPTSYDRILLLEIGERAQSVRAKIEQNPQYQLQKVYERKIAYKQRDIRLWEIQDSLTQSISRQNN